jgi:hypothetical protein
METIEERIQANVYFKNKISLVLAHLLLSQGKCNLDMGAVQIFAVAMLMNYL